MILKYYSTESHNVYANKIYLLLTSPARSINLFILFFYLFINLFILYIYLVILVKMFYIL